MENPMRNRIRQRIAETGKTMEDASVYIGMNRGYVHDFLQERSDKIRFSLVPKLAEFFQCDPRYLTGEIPNPVGPEEVLLPISLLRDVLDALRETGQDLELEVLAHHGGGAPTHPAAQRRFERAMAPARRAVQLSERLSTYLPAALEESSTPTDEALS